MESAAVPAGPAAATPAAPRKRLSDRARAERKTAYLLCAPAVIVMAAVTGYPILYALWLSLHKFDLRFPPAAGSAWTTTARC
jgi:multiple sugar transport system permease protein